MLEPFVVTGNSGGEEISTTQQEGEERGVANRLGVLINAFHELVQSAIPVGPPMDAMVKELTRLYGALSLLAKFVSFIMLTFFICSSFFCFSLPALKYLVAGMLQNGSYSLRCLMAVADS